jgi:hypothetical protein
LWPPRSSTDGSLWAANTALVLGGAMVDSGSPYSTRRRQPQPIKIHLQCVTVSGCSVLSEIHRATTNCLSCGPLGQKYVAQIRSFACMASTWPRNKAPFRTFSKARHTSQRLSLVNPLTLNIQSIRTAHSGADRPTIYWLSIGARR